MFKLWDKINLNTIFAGLVELFMSSSQASCLHNAIILHKCLTSGLWEDSLFICKQLPGIGLKGANTFVNAGYHTFSKLQDLHPREVERVFILILFSGLFWYV